MDVLMEPNVETLPERLQGRGTSKTSKSTPKPETIGLLQAAGDLRREHGESVIKLLQQIVSLQERQLQLQQDKLDLYTRQASVAHASLASSETSCACEPATEQILFSSDDIDSSPTAILGPYSTSVERSASTFMHRNTTKDLLEATWSGESWSFGSKSKLSASSGIIPDEVPTYVCTALFSAGTVNPHPLTSQWRKSVYMLYRVSIPISYMMVGCLFFFEGCLNVALKRPLSGAFGFAVLFMFICPCIWLVACRDFGRTGSSMALLQQMTRRGFNFQSLWVSIVILRVLLIFSFGALLVLAILTSNGEALFTKAELRTARRSGFGALVDVWQICPYVGVVVSLVAVHSSLHGLWMLYLLSKLHQHDLLLYGRCVAAALINGSIESKLVALMEKLETTVTARLQHASEIWVRPIVITCAYIGMLALGKFTYLLLSTKLPTVTILVQTAQVGGMCVGIMYVLICLASVAEEFEHNVLRALNTPLVLNRAIRFFGDQLLPHLKELGWGFRFNGTTINSNLVMTMCLAMAIALVTSVSQTMLNAFEETIGPRWR